jgi:DNA-binding PadR family transcriptional regulator
MKQIEAVLHPIRYRIIQQFLDGEPKTVKELAKEMKDTSQASLYRQLDTLVQAEVLVITKENKIRGTLEKVYSLNQPKAHMTNDDIKDLTKEEHLQYFLFFISQITYDFETYLENETIDFLKDGVGYRQVALHLTDEELENYIKDLRKVYEKYMQYKPTPERTKRMISTITIPKRKREE